MQHFEIYSDGNQLQNSSIRVWHLLSLQMSIVFSRQSKIYWFAILTCFSPFFSPDVCVLCMAARCNLTVAECGAVRLVPCLSSAHETGTIHFSSFINASPHPPLPPFSSLVLFLLNSLHLLLQPWSWQEGIVCLIAENLYRMPFQCDFGFLLRSGNEANGGANGSKGYHTFC